MRGRNCNPFGNIPTVSIVQDVADIVYSGAERFLRLYFSPGFIPRMHYMHSDVSLSVSRVVTS